MGYRTRARAAHDARSRRGAPQMPRLLALVLTAAAALTVEEELDAAYPCFSEALALRATCSCATIDLSNRGLQGTIPPTLALCEDLSALDLRGNGACAPRLS